MRTRIALALIIALLPLASGWQAPAQENPAKPIPSQTVAEIDVLAIRATMSNNTISPELAELAQKLKNKFRYTGYHLEGRAKGKTDMGKALATPPLAGGYVVHVLPKKRDGKRTEMQVRVVQGRRVKLDTTFTANCGAYQFFVLNLPGGEDDLILGVSSK